MTTMTKRANEARKASGGWTATYRGRRVWVLGRTGGAFGDVTVRIAYANGNARDVRVSELANLTAASTTYGLRVYATARDGMPSRAGKRGSTERLFVGWYVRDDAPPTRS